MLIQHCKPEITRPPCDPSSEQVNVIAHVKEDISVLFPYLNALLPKAQFNSRAQTIHFSFKGHHVVLQPHQIAIGGFSDSDAAIETFGKLQQFLNETWNRREQIEPSYVERRRLTPMEVYQLLPRTNCKACGYSSCFIFALKLISGEASIQDCIPLSEKKYQKQLQELGDLLEQAII
ncbi:MAG: hypothetical protein J7M05_09560 [Anaerolineae bacterium]|nr:hypothetical protein [Anaerolineae bacterium]